MLHSAVDEALAKIEGREQGIERRGLVLALLTALKQICNHPAQYLHERGPLAGRSGKLARITEMLEEALATGDRTLVFVLQNVPISGGATGGGGAEGLAAARITIEVRLAAPVAAALDERTGKPLPGGDRLRFELDTAVAVFFSFAGPPPRGTPPAKERPTDVL